MRVGPKRSQEIPLRFHLDYLLVGESAFLHMPLARLQEPSSQVSGGQNIENRRGGGKRADAAVVGKNSGA